MILDNKTSSLNNFPATEISVKKQVKIEPDYLLEGKIIPKKGQVVYEIETATMRIQEAEYERSTVALFGAEIPPRKLIMRQGCIYIPAINKNNAIRKFKKDANQRSYLTVAVSQLSDLKI